MKRFRRITAIALTLVVIAMLGISASAAGSNTIINGDFGVGATFSWNLTTSEARADAVFYGAEEEHIELDYQHLVITGQSVSQNAPYTFSSVEDEDFYYGEEDDYGDYTVAAYVIVSDNYRIQYAKYTYDAYYVANEVVDCYLNYGPVRLNNP